MQKKKGYDCGNTSHEKSKALEQNDENGKEVDPKGKTVFQRESLRSDRRYQGPASFFRVIFSSVAEQPLRNAFVAWLPGRRVRGSQRRSDGQS